MSVKIPVPQFKIPKIKLPSPRIQKAILIIVVLAGISGISFFLGRQNAQTPENNSEYQDIAQNIAPLGGIPVGPMNSGSTSWTQKVPPIPKPDCTITKKKDTVQGTSMLWLLKDGEEITILEGYYSCNEVKRDDIVVYPFAGNAVPIVKSAKGLPGDRFELKQDSNGSWNIVINNKILTTSDGTPYALAQSRHNMLAIYEKSYKNIIPANTYIILGNLPGGTMDSTQFGLVSKGDFIGKVER